MNRKESRSELTAYSSYLTYIDDYLGELGEDSEQIFRDAGISYPAQSFVGNRISVENLNNLVRIIRTKTRYLDFFLQLGQRIPILAHGNFGDAIIACNNIRDVLFLPKKFANILFPSVRFSFSNNTIEYQSSSSYKDLNIALLESFMTHAVHTLSLLTGQEVNPSSITVVHNVDDYLESYLEGYLNLFSCDVEFGAAANTMSFDSKLLEVPILTADPVGKKLIHNRCDDELRNVQTSVAILTQIKEIVSLNLESNPSIAFVAGILNISESTLRRRLNDDGLNYRELLKKVRHEAAIYHLENTELSIESIAQKVGYKDTPNFRKAFKESTGTPPSVWRLKSKNNSR